MKTKTELSYRQINQFVLNSEKKFCGELKMFIQRKCSEMVQESPQGWKHLMCVGEGGGESVVHIKIRFLKFLEGVEKKTFKV